MPQSLARILCVDNDPDMRALLAFALGQIGGLQVAVCASGAEAIETAARFSPDLMLLDDVMPEMDGPTTLRNLRLIKTLSDVPALFLTATDAAGELERRAGAASVGVLTKPFDPMTLAATVRAAWERAHG